MWGQETRSMVDQWSRTTMPGCWISRFSLVNSPVRTKNCDEKKIISKHFTGNLWKSIPLPSCLSPCEKSEWVWNWIFIDCFSRISSSIPRRCWWPFGTIAQLGVQYGHMGYYFITVAFMLVYCGVVVLLCTLLCCSSSWCHVCPCLAFVLFSLYVSQLFCCISIVHTRTWLSMFFYNIKLDP